MKKIKKIAKACADAYKGAYLFSTSTSNYVLFKAKKEKWDGIEIDLGFPDIYRDYFAIIASNKNPDERKREYVVDSYRPKDGEFKLKRPGKEVVVVKDEEDLNKIISLNVFYRIRDFVTEAVKKGIPTNPDLPEVNQQIKAYESVLQKYL
jgi:hypothetical protein